MTTQEHNGEEISGRYKALYTPAIADVLDEKGLHRQVLPHTVQALRWGMQVAGPAHTVKGTSTPNDRAEYLQVTVASMMAIQPPVVLVYDCGLDERASHWGELLSHAARYRGATGAVIDGGVRDVDKFVEMGFPVFCRFRTPADIRGRFRYVEYNLPIQIGEVVIQPQDYIVGDNNGVVVVPKDMIMEVLVEAEEVVRKENLIREDLKTGVDPWQAMIKHGRF